MKRTTAETAAMHGAMTATTCSAFRLTVATGAVLYFEVARRCGH